MPDVEVYDITAVPAETPLIIPVPEPMVAIPVLLVHVPPVVTSVNVIVELTHKLVIPEIGATDVVTLRIRGMLLQAI